jgi:hypothetical protein
VNHAIDSAVHYLVIDSQRGDPIFVFLGQDPEGTPGGPLAERVTLDLLPPGQRYGWPGALGVVRPVLGRSPSCTSHFREFRSEAEREEALYLPVGRYRVCDAWADYCDPWFVPPSAQETEPGFSKTD